MTIKIENIPAEKNLLGSISFEEFVLGIKELKIGQSFFIITCPSNYRTAIATLQYLMDVKLTAYKEGKGYRIGRTE